MAETKINGGELTSGTQIGYASASLSDTGTTTAIIPIDDTVPQNTEGTEILTVTYTPKLATSTLVVRALIFGSSGGTSEGISAALFRDSISDAFTAGMQVPGNNANISFTLMGRILAETTSSTTFKLRIGSNDGLTVRYNGSGGRYFGSTPKTYLEVAEIAA